MKITTKKIAISAFLIAFDVIFTRVLALNMPLTKIGLGFAAVMVCGMLYGPGWTALCEGAGFTVRHFEDASPALARLAAALVWYGDKRSLREWGLCGPGCGGAASRPGYALWIAQKEE